MANLKGSTFDKQIKNAKIRLEARGEKKHLNNDNKTHSNALAQKRDMYLKDFANYASENGLQGKLNEIMTKDTIKDFLSLRTQNLSEKTSLNYASGFSSMIQGLENANISINQEVKEELNNQVSSFRDAFNEVRNDFAANRAIEDKENFITKLNDIREESSIIAKIQLELGYRVSESLEIAKNIDKYYNEEKGTLEGVIGKGGQEYNEKEISYSLVQEIKQMEEIPSYSTYDRDLEKLEVNSHDLRLTYAKDTYEEKIENGASEKEALKETSKELNHHREDITSYYLNRA